MPRFRFPVVRLAQAVVVLSAAAVAGCFGSSGSSVPVSIPPLTGPSNAPFSNSTTVPVSSSTTYPGPSGGGYTSSLNANLATPAPGQTNTVTITIGATPPAGIPPLSLERRSAELAARSPLSAPTAAPTPVGAVILLYETFSTSQNTTETGDPVFTIGVPNTAPSSGVNYYLAIYQSPNWQFGYAPGVFNTGFQTVTLTGAYPLTFTANSPQTFALYYQPTTDPTPTPPPSPTPTTAPTGNAGVGIN
jgi:hypothetical protein